MDRNSSSKSKADRFSKIKFTNLRVSVKSFVSPCIENTSQAALNKKRKKLRKLINKKERK